MVPVAAYAPFPQDFSLDSIGLIICIFEAEPCILPHGIFPPSAAPTSTEGSVAVFVDKLSGADILLEQFGGSPLAVGEARVWRPCWILPKHCAKALALQRKPACPMQSWHALECLVS